MSAQIAVILSQSDLQRMIDTAVELKAAEIRAAYEATRELPERVNVRRAAEIMGISETTFHRKFNHLKQYEGGSVFVLGKDLIR